MLSTFLPLKSSLSSQRVSITASRYAGTLIFAQKTTMATSAHALPWLCALLPALSMASAIERRQSQGDDESYNGGSAGNGGAVDTNAGASGGSSGSFNLSKGGLIAIIVVVVIVVILCGTDLPTEIAIPE
jgi:hypothetical protein